MDHVELKDYLKEIQNLYPVSPAIKQAEKVVGQYKHQLKALQDPKVSDQAKVRLASRIKPVHKSMLQLKNMMPDDKFAMFYRNVIEGESMQSLGLLYGCDPKTVRRTKKQSLQALIIDAISGS